MVHHAEDEWSDLVGDILVLPPERKHTNSDDAGVSIRDKVAKMNEWAFANRMLDVMLAWPRP